MKHAAAITDKIEQALGTLMEHFDCVQVLASRQTPSRETESFYMGAGNWFARQGMAQDFLNKDQAHTQAHEIAGALPHNPPAEGEDWKNTK